MKKDIEICEFKIVAHVEDDEVRFGVGARFDDELFDTVKEHGNKKTLLVAKLELEALLNAIKEAITDDADRLEFIERATLEYIGIKENAKVEIKERRTEA